MYCPQCSQQQAAGDVRYCPRCGFPLGGVKELMAGGGIPSMAAVAQNGSPRQRGIRQGARLTFLSVILFPIFVGFAVAFDSPGPMVISFTLFLAGICWMLYARLFGESFLPAFGHAADAQLAGRAPAADNSLPAAPPRAAALNPQPVNTAEMMRPPSVVDHTTNLLDRH